MWLAGLLRLALFSGMCMLTSCWAVMPSCRGRFNTYRLPMLDTSVVFHPRTDGIYVCEEANGIFSFRGDGQVKYYPNMIAKIPKESFWGDPAIIIEHVKRFDALNRREFWGAYAMIGSVLRVQHFNYHQTEFCKRSVFEYFGTMENDSSFVITSEIAYWFDKAPDTTRYRYRFYPTEFTPDDRRIWFENRRWYKRGLHPSRAR